MNVGYIFAHGQKIDPSREEALTQDALADLQRLKETYDLAAWYVDREGPKDDFFERPAARQMRADILAYGRLTVCILDIMALGAIAGKNATCFNSARKLVQVADVKIADFFGVEATLTPENTWVLEVAQNGLHWIRKWNQDHNRRTHEARLAMGIWDRGAAPCGYHTLGRRLVYSQGWEKWRFQLHLYDLGELTLERLAKLQKCSLAHLEMSIEHERSIDALHRGVRLRAVHEDSPVGEGPPLPGPNGNGVREDEPRDAGGASNDAHSAGQDKS